MQEEDCERIEKEKKEEKKEKSKMTILAFLFFFSFFFLGCFQYSPVVTEVKEINITVEQGSPLCVGFNESTICGAIIKQKRIMSTADLCSRPVGADIPELRGIEIVAIPDEPELNFYVMSIAGGWTCHKLTTSQQRNENKFTYTFVSRTLGATFTGIQQKYEFDIKERINKSNNATAPSTTCTVVVPKNRVTSSGRINIYGGGQSKSSPVSSTSTTVVSITFTSTQTEIVISGFGNFYYYGECKTTVTSLPNYLCIHKDGRKIPFLHCDKDENRIKATFQGGRMFLNGSIPFSKLSEVISKYYTKGGTEQVPFFMIGQGQTFEDYEKAKKKCVPWEENIINISLGPETFEPSNITLQNNTDICFENLDKITHNISFPYLGTTLHPENIILNPNEKKCTTRAVGDYTVADMTTGENATIKVAPRGMDLNLYVSSKIVPEYGIVQQGKNVKLILYDKKVHNISGIIDGQERNYVIGPGPNPREVTFSINNLGEQIIRDNVTNKSAVIFVYSPTNKFTVSPTGISPSFIARPFGDDICFETTYKNYTILFSRKNEQRDYEEIDSKDLQTGKVCCFENLIPGEYKVNVYPSSPISMDESTVAYYKFEEVGNTVIDSAGGNNGITNAQRSAGYIGRGIFLSGYDEINISKIINLTNNFTVEAMIYPTSFDKNRIIVSAGMSCSSPRSWEFYVTGDGKLGFSLSTNGSNFITATSAARLQSNKWYHVAVVYTNKKVIFYINGTKQEVTTTAPKDEIYPSSKNFKIGAGYCPPDDQNVRYFNGTIDEVVIWNRVLSDSEIQQHYNSLTTTKAESSFESKLLIGNKSTATININKIGFIPEEIESSPTTIICWENPSARDREISVTGLIPSPKSINIKGLDENCNETIYDNEGIFFGKNVITNKTVKMTVISAKTYRIEVRKNVFNPMFIEARPGDKVCWINVEKNEINLRTENELQKQLQPGNEAADCITTKDNSYYIRKIENTNAISVVTSAKKPTLFIIPGIGIYPPSLKVITHEEFVVRNTLTTPVKFVEEKVVPISSSSFGSSFSFISPLNITFTNYDDKPHTINITSGGVTIRSFTIQPGNTRSEYLDNPSEYLIKDETTNLQFKATPCKFYGNVILNNVSKLSSRSFILAGCRGVYLIKDNVFNSTISIFVEQKAAQELAESKEPVFQQTMDLPVQRVNIYLDKKTLQKAREYIHKGAVPVFIPYFGSQEIKIRANTFEEDKIKMTPGSILTLTNDDDIPHTIIINKTTFYPNCSSRAPSIFECNYSRSYRMCQAKFNESAASQVCNQYVNLHCFDKISGVSCTTRQDGAGCRFKVTQQNQNWATRTGTTCQTNQQFLPIQSTPIINCSANQSVFTIDSSNSLCDPTGTWVCDVNQSFSDFNPVCSISGQQCITTSSQNIVSSCPSGYTYNLSSGYCEKITYSSSSSTVAGPWCSDKFYFSNCTKCGCAFRFFGSCGACNSCCEDCSPNYPNCGGTLSSCEVEIIDDIPYHLFGCKKRRMVCTCTTTTASVSKIRPTNYNKISQYCTDNCQRKPGVSTAISCSVNPAGGCIATLIGNGCIVNPNYRVTNCTPKFSGVYCRPTSNQAACEFNVSLAPAEGILCNKNIQGQNIVCSNIYGGYTCSPYASACSFGPTTFTNCPSSDRYCNNICNYTYNYTFSLKSSITPGRWWTWITPGMWWWTWTYDLSPFIGYATCGGMEGNTCKSSIRNPSPTVNYPRCFIQNNYYNDWNETYCRKYTYSNSTVQTVVIQPGSSYNITIERESIYILTDITKQEIQNFTMIVEVEDKDVDLYVGSWKVFPQISEVDENNPVEFYNYGNTDISLSISPPGGNINVPRFDLIPGFGTLGLSGTGEANFTFGGLQSKIISTNESSRISLNLSWAGFTYKGINVESVGIPLGSKVCMKTTDINRRINVYDKNHKYLFSANVLNYTPNVNEVCRPITNCMVSPADVGKYECTGNSSVGCKYRMLVDETACEKTTGPTCKAKETHQAYITCAYDEVNDKCIFQAIDDSICNQCAPKIQMPPSLWCYGNSTVGCSFHAWNKTSVANEFCTVETAQISCPAGTTPDTTSIPPRCNITMLSCPIDTPTYDISNDECIKSVECNNNNWKSASCNIGNIDYNEDMCVGSVPNIQQNVLVECPSPYLWNHSWWDGTTNSLICNTSACIPPASYDPSVDVCYIPVNCGGGTYNSTIDKCVIDPICSEEGYSYNPTTDNCTKTDEPSLPAICTQGILNTTIDKCVYSAVCPTIDWLTFSLNTARDRCEAIDCPTPNPSSITVGAGESTTEINLYIGRNGNKCEAYPQTYTIQCPNSEVWITDSGEIKCIAPPNCDGNYYYNTSLDKCCPSDERNPVPDCPQLQDDDINIYGYPKREGLLCYVDARFTGSFSPTLFSDMGCIRGSKMLGDENKAYALPPTTTLLLENRSNPGAGQYVAVGQDCTNKEITIWNNTYNNWQTVTVNGWYDPKDKTCKYTHSYNTGHKKPDYKGYGDWQCKWESCPAGKVEVDSESGGCLFGGGWKDVTCCPSTHPNYEKDSFWWMWGGGVWRCYPNCAQGYTRTDDPYILGDRSNCTRTWSWTPNTGCSPTSDYLKYFSEGLLYIVTQTPYCLAYLNTTQRSCKSYATCPCAAWNKSSIYSPAENIQCAYSSEKEGGILIKNEWKVSDTTTNYCEKTYGTKCVPKSGYEGVVCSLVRDEFGNEKCRASGDWVDDHEGKCSLSGTPIACESIYPNAECGYNSLTKQCYLSKYDPEYCFEPEKEGMYIIEDDRTFKRIVVNVYKREDPLKIELSKSMIIPSRVETSPGAEVCFRSIDGQNRRVSLPPICGGTDIIVGNWYNCRNFSPSSCGGWDKDASLEQFVTVFVNVTGAAFKGSSTILSKFDDREISVEYSLFTPHKVIMRPGSNLTLVNVDSKNRTICEVDSEKNFMRIEREGGAETLVGASGSSIQIKSGQDEACGEYGTTSETVGYSFTLPKGSLVDAELIYSFNDNGIIWINGEKVVDARTRKCAESPGDYYSIPSVKDVRKNITMELNENVVNNITVRICSCGGKNGTKITLTYKYFPTAPNCAGRPTWILTPGTKLSFTNLEDERKEFWNPEFEELFTSTIKACSGEDVSYIGNTVKEYMIDSEKPASRFVGDPCNTGSMTECRDYNPFGTVTPIIITSELGLDLANSSDMDCAAGQIVNIKSSCENCSAALLVNNVNMTVVNETLNRISFKRQNVKPDIIAYQMLLDKSGMCSFDDIMNSMIKYGEFALYNYKINSLLLDIGAKETVADCIKCRPKLTGLTYDCHLEGSLCVADRKIFSEADAEKYCSITLADSKSLSCPTYFRYNSTIKSCVPENPNQQLNPICPTNYYYNSSSDTCKVLEDKKQIDPSCSSSYTWNATTKRCEKKSGTTISTEPPTCLEHYNYNSWLGKCVATEEVQATCIDSFVLNPQIDKCVPVLNVYPRCPTDYRFNPKTDRCEKNRCSPKTGYTNLVDCFIKPDGTCNMKFKDPYSPQLCEKVNSQVNWTNETIRNAYDEFFDRWIMQLAAAGYIGAAQYCYKDPCVGNDYYGVYTEWEGKKAWSDAWFKSGCGRYYYNAEGLSLLTFDMNYTEVPLCNPGKYMAILQQLKCLVQSGEGVSTSILGTS